MSISQETRNAIRDASRDQIQKILESYGFGVYDHEDTEDLRRSVLMEVEAGEIDEADLFEKPDRLRDPRDR